MKRKVTAIVLTFVLTSAFFAGCGSAESAASNQQAGTSEDISASVVENASEESYEPATIRIGVATGRTPHLTAIVAQQEGIFDKYNLDVQVFEFSAGIDTINAIELGQVDLGYVADFAGLNRIGNLTDPSDSNLRFIARLEKTATVALYVNPDTVSSLEDLEGKSVALQLGTVTEYYNINALEQGGLTVDDVEITPIDSMQTGLALADSGDIDAVWAGSANVTQLAAYGFTELINQEELGLYQDSVYVSTDAYISSDSDVIERFLKATGETYDFIAENFDQSVEDISSATGMDSTVVDDTLNGTVLQLDFSNELIEDLQALNQWMIDYGYYENSIDFEQFMYTDLLKNALPEADIY